MHDQFGALDDIRVAVVGDLMLDRYIGGSVGRISPEAPVPVLHVDSERLVPGGAANVAANLAALGIGVRLVGVVGDDDARGQLMAALAACGSIDSSGIVVAGDRQTTQKLRVIGEHQQIVRIDWEDRAVLSASLEEQCIAAGRAAIDDCALLIISDYNKGMCSDAVLRALIDHAVAQGKPITVDPKRNDFSVYRGATLLTPNRRELTGATGMPCESDDEAALAVEAAQSTCDASILLTRSEKGMSLYPLGGAASHLPTVAQKVFDVSGAGDTVIAVMAATMASGFAVEDQLRMANHAAGLVVSKLGTATVSRQELATAIADPSPSHGNLVRTWEQMAVQRAAWEAEKLSVGFTNGCFDLLHPGHISLLEQASSHCDRLIVGLNTDASVRRLKGSSRPIMDEDARARVLSALRMVSAVVLFDDNTPLEIITALQPDLLVKGSDYAEDAVVGWDVVKARGGRLLLATLEPDRSTTKLVQSAQRSATPIAV